MTSGHLSQQLGLLLANYSSSGGLLGLAGAGAMAAVRAGVMEICYLNLFGTLFPCLIPQPGLLFTGYSRVNPPCGNKRLHGDPLPLNGRLDW